MSICYEVIGCPEDRRHDGYEEDAKYCPDCEIFRLLARLKEVEQFLADNADYDHMTEKEQEWFIENIHKKYYPENY